MAATPDTPFDFDFDTNEASGLHRFQLWLMKVTARSETDENFMRQELAEKLADFLVANWREVWPTVLCAVPFLRVKTYVPGTHACHCNGADIAAGVGSQVGGTRGYIQRRLKEARHLADDEPSKLLYDRCRAQRDSMEGALMEIFGPSSRDVARRLAKEVHNIGEDGTESLQGRQRIHRLQERSR